MAGVYRARHPERTALYRVLFHYFDQFLANYDSRFEKEYGFFRPIIKEVVERYLDCGNPRCGFARIRCPECGGRMRIIAFLTDYAVVDRIINHLKLTFVASKPPPPRVAYQELLMAAEAGGEYFS
jgi:hypothetical protein